MEPGGAAFAPRVLLSLGRTAFALLRRPLMFFCSRRVFHLALLGRPLMLLCNRPVFRRLLSLSRGTVLTHPGLLLCCRRKFRGPFVLTPSLGVLIARPAGVRLGLLTMAGCLAAKALALAAAVLGRPPGSEQHQREHDQDADYDRDHGDGGHAVFLPRRSISHARHGSAAGTVVTAAADTRATGVVVSGG